jgi:hypothetical protein
MQAGFVMVALTAAAYAVVCEKFTRSAERTIQ